MTALFRKLEADTPAGKVLVFNGLDRILQSAPELGREDLDAFFPSRPVLVIDDSGHEAYFNTAHVDALGWEDRRPPANPTGGHYGRDAQGLSDGRAYELPAVMAVSMPMIPAAGIDPLAGAAKWYRLMAENGITATTDHTFAAALLPLASALASQHDSPLRLSLYHMATDNKAHKPLPHGASNDMLRKVGIKIWADGSPWVGNIAATYPYLDNETVHAAGIPVGPTRESALNYTPAELDDLLDSFSDDDWQFAVHVNGDYALDVVLDSYQRELTRCALLGTDHRWRVKHVGSQWQRFAGAVDAGASVSFHNDGSVSPPIPLRNIQAAVTRHTFSGEEHGPEQRMSLDDALRAHTVVAAQHIRRPDLGSITHEARSLALRRFGRRDARRVDHRIAHPAVRRVARRDARVVTCRPDRPARVGVIRNL